ncbi:hypothetical protein BAMA_06380 [Bacillus manliponensis]|uniref:DUF2584 domain-containing protein n=1 Tax=Bacillus manliponensis TaxID=574376 RepID=A0A073JVE8_9BACI|nr:DUF2584 family protein [Bacillus manliponensis]KEK18186.1 hypothetical protein BAMA_06380 [Bacillus manliponensis]
MKFEMCTTILTNNEEVRLHTEKNIFELTLSGYYLFVMDETIPLYKTKQEQVGNALVKKIEWTEGRTILQYQLLSLHSVN